jgi:hypothetical protein
VSDPPLGRRAQDAVDRSGELGERTRRNTEATEEGRFRSRQARTVAQMLRWLRRERGGPEERAG